MNWIKLLAVNVILLMIIMSFSPVVDAASGATNPRSGKTEQVSRLMTINADSNFNYTEKFNLASSSFTDYLNFNYTIAPFLAANPDITGIVVAPFYLPMTMNATISNAHISLANLFRMPVTEVINGASEFWIRVPILDIPADTDIRLRIARISDPNSFNVTLGAAGAAMFVHPENVKTVCDVTYDGNVSKYGDVPVAFPDSWYQHTRTSSIEFNNTGKYYNHTYLKVDAGLFADEWYFIMFDLTFPSATNNLKFSIAMDDVAGDSSLRSYTYFTSYKFLAADLDMSMIFTKGLSNGLTGIGTVGVLPLTQTGNNSFHLNTTIPMAKIVNVPYFQLLIPTLSLTYGAGTKVNITINMYGATNNVIFHNVTNQTLFNSTYEYIIQWYNVTALSAMYCNHVTIEIEIPTAFCSKFRIWGMQSPASAWANTLGHTDLYFHGYYNNYTKEEYNPYEKVDFVPYGFYDFSSSYWNMTTRNILIIPTNTPNSTIGIYQAVYNVGLKYQHADSQLDRIVWFLGVAADVYIKLLSYYIQTAIDIFLKFTPIGWFLMNYVIPAIISFASTVWSLFMGFVNWFKGVVDFLVDALEWFGYWAVRFIYAASMIIVYMVNVFGVISINAALLAYARTGKLNDFTRQFKSGWNFVWTVISMLLSLLIMAVSIVGAVVPF